MIAQRPLPDRSQSRLMVVRRSGDGLEHSRFACLPEHLSAGDVLVVNRSRVVPARLFVRRRTGGRVEVLFLRKLAGRTFRALVNPAGKLKIGEELTGENGSFVLEVTEKPSSREVDLVPAGNASIEELMDEFGHVPLPPYIRRLDEEKDRERYQTVFADEPGSVAAPTAGLHFDAPLLEAIRDRGVKIVSVVLHVGPGTFLPLAEEEVEKNVLHRERFGIGAEALEAIRRAKGEGGKVVAVGTTTTRVLEACSAMGVFSRPGAARAFEGETDLFIYPGYRFDVVDALVTNFHLPRSSLLLLVCAFLGRERALACYEEAVKEEYRFYSYGDAMLIV